MKKKQRIEIKPGQRFGKLTVIEEIHSDDRKHRKIKCKCDCGNFHITQPAHLITGHVTQCRECFKKHSSNIHINKTGYTLEKVIDTYRKLNISYLDTWYHTGKDHHNLKCNICGHEWKSTFNNTINHVNRSCPRCQINRAVSSSRYTIDEIKEKLAKVNLEYLDDNYKNKNELHKFKCNKCGEIFETRLKYILKSTSGHDYKIRLEDIQSVLKTKQISLKEKTFNAVNDICHFKCDKCGHEWHSELSHLYYSNTSGCPRCHRFGGGGEDLVYDILKNIFSDLKIERQYPIRTFNERKNKNVTQYIDYYISDIKLAIEYNGRQHYESIHINNVVNMDADIQKERDARKRKYCIDNDIKLVEIDGREFEKNTKRITYERIKDILVNNSVNM